MDYSIKNIMKMRGLSSSLGIKPKVLENTDIEKPYIGRVFIDARVLLSSMYEVLQVYITCSHRLIFELDTLAQMGEAVSNKFKDYDGFITDANNVQLCYCQELDCFIEELLYEYIVAGKVKAFNTVRRIQYNYSVTNDGLHAIAKTDILYKGRTIETLMH